MKKEHHQLFVDSYFFKKIKKVKKNQKNIEKVKKNQKKSIRKHLYLKKFHICKFCSELFIEHKQLEDHLKKFHNIDEENFDEIYGDIKEICCQTNSNETQVGKRKILLKNFYQCSFCKQVFAKDHQQLKIHIKEFHKFEEEDFQIKSNKLIEENWMIQMKLINQNLSREKKNKAEITNVKSMKKRNSTTSNKKKESQCLSSISIESKNQPRKKERNVESKKNLKNLENNNIKVVALKEYDDNIIEEQNTTTSCKKRKMERGLPSISCNSECQPTKKGKNDSESPIKIITLEEYDNDD